MTKTKGSSRGSHEQQMSKSKAKMIRKYTEREPTPERQHQNNTNNTLSKYSKYSKRPKFVI
jgi:hypothetical protein